MNKLYNEEVADVRVNEIIDAHILGKISRNGLQDECISILMNILNIRESDESKKGSWIKERMENQERKRKCNRDFTRHICFNKRPTRLHIVSK
uniref:Uncharacterized protein n=1 Tax=Pyramimonas orientalis virus TaxID=455367 RepID=A0A7L9AZ30_POV01|nr:hypothetical protein HWQ62_00429 [Pyramimonas orientalis virus]